MARKMLSKVAFKALVASEAESFRIAVYWDSARPSRAEATALFNTVLNGPFTLELCENEDAYVLEFFDQQDAAKIAEAGPSFIWTSRNSGRLAFRDFRLLAE